MKTLTPRNRTSKYQYRTQTTSRATPNPLENSSAHKKELRSKFKKENTESSTAGNQRFVLAELSTPHQPDHSQQNTIHFQDHSKKEVQLLKTKNDTLEDRIRSQAREMEQLRTELGRLRSAAESSQSVKEAEQLRGINQALQEEFEGQGKELTALRREVDELKELLSLSQSQLHSFSSVGEENELSRRIEYVNNYEQHLNSSKTCLNCKQIEQDAQLARQRYGQELRNLEEQMRGLKEKEMLLSVAEQQVRNKNECIDFLRNELAAFEDSSRHLLNVIHTLEQRVEAVSQRRGQRWDSFQSFSNY